jgi:hypothetical protein
MSTSSGKLPPKLSQTVIVEMAVDLLVPFGSSITGLELEEDVVAPPPADEEALKLETVPIAFAVPTG